MEILRTIFGYQHSLVGDLLQEIGINTKFGLNFLTLGFLKVAYAEKEKNWWRYNSFEIQ